VGPGRNAPLAARSSVEGRPGAMCYPNCTGRGAMEIDTGVGEHAWLNERAPACTGSRAPTNRGMHCPAFSIRHIGFLELVTVASPL